MIAGLGIGLPAILRAPRPRASGAATTLYAMKFLVKLSPEITIKSRPVRQRFTNQLRTNIARVFRYYQIGADVVSRWDMLEVLVPVDLPEPEYRRRCEQARYQLGRLPGIAHFIQVQERVIDLETPLDTQLEVIARETLAIYRERVAGRSFAVRCKRQGDHVFSSHQVERYVGAEILKHCAPGRVQLKDPEVTVSLEIKRSRLYIVEQRDSGLGGYPIGCVGPALSLISGGYDSSVASFMAMRRGMNVNFCFFNLGGHGHEVGVKQVSHFLWEQYSCTHHTAFINIDFAEVVAEILTKISNPFMGVVLKRMMYRAASQIAEQMQIDTLITGENVAQVSSQTIKNLAVIDSVSDTLVMRPLIMHDKSDIIEQAVRIGVAEFAEHMPEYCAVISDKPATAAKLVDIEREEALFDFAVLQRAVADRRLCRIDKLYQQEVHAMAEVESLSMPRPGQVVIDLRAPDEADARPLTLHANKVMQIPFFQINRLFGTLEKNAQYLLYCDRGVMSKLHAAHLRAEGFDNVDVYRPDAASLNSAAEPGAVE